MKLRQGLIAVIVLLLGVGSSTVGAVDPRPKVWVDSATGYAISGFDPVSYFVTGKAYPPRGGLTKQPEAFFAGASWKFKSTGNRDAFLAHPRNYAPWFGGLDPVFLGLGNAVNGNPVLFDIYKNRLYLFYNENNLQQFRKQRIHFIMRAQKIWPKAAREVGLDPEEITNPKQQSGLDPLGQCEPARWRGMLAGPLKK